MMEKPILYTNMSLAISEASNIFRGSLPPHIYKDYILTMFFLKYISDNPSNGLYAVPKGSSFHDLCQQGHENKIGERIDKALSKMELVSLNDKRRESMRDIFQGISFNSVNLGEPNEKNAKLSGLLEVFSRINLHASCRQEHDVIAMAFEDALATFAEGVGKKAGPFFTPVEISALLAQLLKSPAEATICDPACGTGTLLVKVGEACEGGTAHLYGQEIDGNTRALAVINLAIHGCRDSVVSWGDTLRNPKFKESKEKLTKFDVVVSCPPFAIENWGAQEAEHDVYNRFRRGIPPKNKGEWAFICHMIETAKDKTGRVGVVVPHGVLFRGASEGRIRQQIIKENLLEAVIGLPANLFYGTDIPTAVMIFNKGKQTDNVLFIDASRETGKDKNQKNRLTETAIGHITDTYQQFTKGALHAGVVKASYAFVAAPDDMRANDYNLNISRYVNTEEETAETDAESIQKEIEQLEARLHQVEQEIEKCVYVLNRFNDEK